MKLLLSLFLYIFSIQASYGCYYEYSGLAEFCHERKEGGHPFRTGGYGEETCYGEIHVGCTSTGNEFCHNMNLMGGCCLDALSVNPKKDYIVCPQGLNPPIINEGRSSSPHIMCGSIVDVDSQVLIEKIPLTGTPYNLIYSSRKTSGAKYNNFVKIPIFASDFFNGGGVYVSVEIDIEVAGRSFSATYVPSPGLSHIFSWDGKDSLGNFIKESTFAEVKIIYNMNHTDRIGIPKEFTIPLGLVAEHQSIAPGWDFDVRHVYDSVRSTLFKGNGESFKAKALERSDGTKIIISNDRREIFVFDSSFKHIETRDFLTGIGRLFFSYDTSGQLVSIRDAHSQVTSIAYASGVISSVTSPFGKISTITSDTDGRVISVSNSLSELYSMTYSANDLLLTFMKPNGNLSTFTYNSMGRLVTDYNNEGSELNIDVVIDDLGEEISITSALGFLKTIRTLSTPVSFNRTVSYPNSSYETYEENLGKAKFSKDGASIEAISNTDSRFSGLVFKEASKKIILGGVEREIFYDDSAVLNSSDFLDVNSYSYSITENSESFLWNYIASTKTLTATSPEGRSVVTKFTNKGDVSEKQVGALLASEFSYNSLGQLVSRKQGGREFLFDYSLTSGLITQITNPLMQTVSYAYDSLDRLTSISLPDSRVIGVSYDFNGNLTSITPPSRPTHTIFYNGYGYLGEYIPPTVGLPSSITVYSYNNDRKISSIARPSGDSISYNYYGPGGDLSSISFPLGSRYFSFSAGRLNSSTSEDGVSFFKGYTDGFNYFESIFTSNFHFNLYRSLNNRHQIASEELNIGVYVLNLPYSYDKDGLLTETGPLSLTRHLDLGFVTKLDSTNMEIGFTYSSNYGELSGIKSTFNSTTDTYQTTYTRDLLGRISILTEKYQSGPTTTYEYIYDVTGRLTEVKVGSVTAETYGYDSNSNRNTQTIASTTTTATYDDQDRLLTFGSKAFTYNANGELQTQTDGSVTKTFTYDVFGNLKSVILPSKTINYHVDAHDRRIARLEDTTYTHHYIWSDKKIIGIADDLGILLARFIYASKDHIPDYMITDTAEYMIVSNHLGSPVQVVDVNSGVVIQEIKYNVWGEIISDTNPGFQPFGFAGCLYDQDTKLCRFGARDYDPSIGRWLSKDPILFNGGDTNLYGYVFNDPVNFIDSNGLSAEDIRRIQNTFNKSVTRMTANGQRRSPGWLNNISSSLNDVTGGRMGTPYLGCGDQADIVQIDLQNGSYDDKWSFDWDGLYDPFPHQRIRATSSNPDDPSLIIDPHRNLFQVGR